MRRATLLLAVTVLLPREAFAQASLASELKRCAAIGGIMDRLACYDRLAGQPPGAAPSGPSPQFELQSPEDTVAEFGTDTIPQPEVPLKRSPLDSITAKVTGFRFDPRGHFIVTLANGQVWRQLEGDTIVPLLNKNKTYTATISRGFLGSYNLSFGNSGGLLKVVRVR